MKKKQQKKKKKQQPPSSTAPAAAASTSTSNPPPGPPQPPASLGTRSQSKAAELEDLRDECFIVQSRQISYLLNLAITSHPSVCKKPVFEVMKSYTELVSCYAHIVCNNCEFKTAPVPMFEKLTKKIDDVILEDNPYFVPTPNPENRGPKHSLLNCRAAQALTGSSIGAVGFHEILNKMGIDAGSIPGMQRLITRIGEINRIAAEESMKRAREELVVLKEKGEEIAIAADGQFSNKHNYSFVPGEPAKQSVFTTVSLNTYKITSQQHNSKLCLMCSKKQTDMFLKGEIVDFSNLPKCDDPKCSRNLEPQATISDEGRLLAQSLDDLAADRVEIDVVVTDGDSKCLKEIKKRGIEGASDVRHLSKNIVKKVSQKSSPELKDFSGPNVDERKKEWDIFKNAIMKRCNAENKAATNKSKRLRGVAKLKSVKGKLKNATQAIMACHQGECGYKCYKFSNVCQGYSKNRRKVYFTYAPKPKLCERNKKIVRALIKERFSKLTATYRNLGTNIVEAYHKVYIKSCPKVHCFSRNYKSRHHNSVVIINEGLVGGVKLFNRLLGKQLPKSNYQRLQRLTNRNLKIKEWNQSLVAKIRYEAKTAMMQKAYKTKRLNKGKGKNPYGRAVDLS